MMSQFKNAPLVKAVFEIRFPAELSIECNNDKYYEKIRNKFPQIFIPKTSSSEAYALEAYQFSNIEEDEIIRFSINKFAFVTERYKNFKEFKQKCLDCMIPFCELYKISNLNRTGLRYINHIPIVREDGSIPIEKYLKIENRFPNSVPNKFTVFSSETVARVKEGKLRMLIRYEGLAKEIIVVDFDYFLEKELNTTKIPECLDSSHNHTKEIFLSLITEEYRKTMEGK